MVITSKVCYIILIHRRMNLFISLSRDLSLRNLNVWYKSDVTYLGIRKTTLRYIPIRFPEFVHFLIWRVVFHCVSEFWFHCREFFFYSLKKNRQHLFALWRVSFSWSNYQSRLQLFLNFTSLSRVFSNIQFHFFCLQIQLITDFANQQLIMVAETQRPGLACLRSAW